MIEYRDYVILSATDPNDRNWFHSEEMRQACLDQLRKEGFRTHYYIFFPKDHGIKTPLDCLRGYPNPLFSAAYPSILEVKRDIDYWIDDSKTIIS